MTASATDPPAVTGVAIPDPPPGHGLLTGKVVVITAAAGTGIGFATASAASRKGPPWWSPTPTSGGWGRRPRRSPRSPSWTASVRWRCPAT